MHLFLRNFCLDQKVPSLNIASMPTWRTKPSDFRVMQCFSDTIVVSIVLSLIFLFFFFFVKVTRYEGKTTIHDRKRHASSIYQARNTSYIECFAETRAAGHGM